MSGVVIWVIFGHKKTEFFGLGFFVLMGAGGFEPPKV